MYCKGTLWKQNSLYSNFEFVVITPTCFCIYRFKCSNAISGWMGMDGWVWKSLWAPLLKAKLMALVLPFALNGTLERLPRVLVPGSWCWCVTLVTHFIHLQLSSISFHKWHNCPRIDLCLFLTTFNWNGWKCDQFERTQRIFGVRFRSVPKWRRQCCSPLKTAVKVLITDFMVIGKRYNSVIIVSFINLFSESNKGKG